MSEPLPTPPARTLVEIVAFCTAQKAEAERLSKARRSAADAWSTGTEAEHREAHEMAQRQSGRPMPFNNAAERSRLAAIELRIAAKYDADAVMFESIVSLLASPAPALVASLLTNDEWESVFEDLAGVADDLEDEALIASGQIVRERLAKLRTLREALSPAAAKCPDCNGTRTYEYETCGPAGTVTRDCPTCASPVPRSGGAVAEELIAEAQSRARRWDQWYLFRSEQDRLAAKAEYDFFSRVADALSGMSQAPAPRAEGVMPPLHLRDDLGYPSAEPERWACHRCSRQQQGIPVCRSWRGEPPRIELRFCSPQCQEAFWEAEALARLRGESQPASAPAAPPRSDGQEQWSSEPPTTQGWYWHLMNVDESRPLPVSVLFSGTSGKCFVSAGQLGLTRAIDCDEYGGWWLPCNPPLSSPASPRPEDEP